MTGLLDSRARPSFTTVASCSEPKPVAFLTSMTLLSTSGGVLFLGVVCGALDRSLRPDTPSSLNLFTIRWSCLLLLPMSLAASSLVILTRSGASVLATALVPLPHIRRLIP